METATAFSTCGVIRPSNLTDFGRSRNRSVAFATTVSNKVIILSYLFVDFCIMFIIIYCILLFNNEI